MSIGTIASTTASAAEKITHASHESVAVKAVVQSLVLHFDELPEWMQGDPYIQRGYRRELESFKACLWSLFHVHNELVNTWSHLVPALFFAALLVRADLLTLHCREGLEISWADRLVLQIYVAGTAACLIFSAMFHGINAHSHNVARRLLKLDYLGIVLTISTTSVSATYFGLYGDGALQTIYISLTVVFAAAIFWIVLDVRMDGAHAAAWRAIVFTSLACSGFAPIVHVAVVRGCEALDKFPLMNIGITCLSYAIGMTIYIMRVPEKIWPNSFDIWGASHQIFHVLVAFGQIVHLWGLKSALLKHYV